MYRINRILNNNVVIAENDKKEEFILVGKAIGFKTQRGMFVPEDRIQSTFVKKKEGKLASYEKILANIDNQVIGVSEEVISMCENELKLKLNNSIHISLPDHVSFAIDRYKAGMNIEIPFFTELKILFPKEFEVSKKALEMINKKLEIDLPEDEIGSICLHIRAAIMEESVGTSLSYTKKMSQILEFIEKILKKEMKKDSLEYIRTISHLNFMYERIKNNRTMKNELLDSIKKELYVEYDLAVKVALKFQGLFELKIPEDEIGYIALHLKRLSQI